jgi:hypothetical protein
LWIIGVIIFILMMATAFIGKIDCLKWYNLTCNFLLINYFALLAPTFFSIDSWNEVYFFYVTLPFPPAEIV